MCPWKPSHHKRRLHKDPNGLVCSRAVASTYTVMTACTTVHVLSLTTMLKFSYPNTASLYAVHTLTQQWHMIPQTTHFSPNTWCVNSGFTAMPPSSIPLTLRTVRTKKPDYTTQGCSNWNNIGAKPFATQQSNFAKGKFMRISKVI